MIFGDLEEASSEISRILSSRAHHAQKPEAGTKPYVFYLE